MEEKLPELPEGWVSIELNNIVEEIEKINPKIAPDKEFIYIDISSIDNKMLKIVNPKKYYGAEAPSRARQVIRTGDVLFSTVRTYLKNIAIVDQKYNNQVASTGFCVIRPHGLINNSFIYYLVQSDVFINSLSNKQRGTSYPAVRDSDVFSKRIAFPPLPEQHRIVDKIEELFSRLDAGIESLKKVQAQIKRYRQAVLKHAFEGHLTAAWREANKHQLEPASAILEIFKTKGKKCIAKRQKNLPFPDTAGLYELPDGWEWTSLHNIADMSSGKAFKKSEYAQTGVRLLQIANVSFGKIVWDNVSYLPSSYLEKHPKLVLKPGDILIALNRPILNDMLKIGILKDCDLPAILYQRVGRFDFFNTHVINKSYFFYLVQSPYFIRKVKISLQGVDQPFINKPALLKISVPLPPLLEQKKIVEEIERRFSIVDRVEEIVEQNLKKAERLRQSILKKAFEGKLVPQDPTDEPASVLLERIKAEKEKNATEKDQRRRSKK